MRYINSPSNIKSDYVNLTDDQTIDGVKSFIEYPEIASGSLYPVDDNQLATKKYVDDFVLQEDTTYYISTTGSDVTGDGSSGNPFATANHILSLFPKNLGGYEAKISYLFGAYTISELVEIDSFYNGTISIETVRNTTFSIESGDGFIQVSNNAAYIRLSLKAITLTEDNTTAIFLENNVGTTLVISTTIDSTASGNTGGFTITDCNHVELDSVGDGSGTHITQGYSVTNSLVIGVPDNPLGATIINPDSAFVSLSSDDKFLYSPEAVPTEDYQYVNKKYVDDEIDDIPLDSGTASGQLLFWNGSEWTPTVTSELIWDNTNTRLGIGTDSPSYAIDIHDTGLVAQFGSDPAVIAVGSIGTDEVNSFIGGYYDAGGASTIYFGQNLYYDGSSWVRSDTGEKTALQLMQEGAHYFYTGSTGIGSQKLKIENDGVSTFYGEVKLSNVSLMGTNDSSLATKKYVDDEISGVTETDTLQSVTDRGATTTNDITIDGGGSVNSVLNINGTADSYIRSTAVGQLQLGHGGTEVLTVAPTGKVGFGTTSPITDFMIYKTAGVSVSLVGGNTGNATIDLLKDFGSTGGFGTAGAYGFRVGYHATANLFKIQAGSTTTIKDALCIPRDTAYIGFGTETPTCPVDINTLNACGANLQGGVNLDVVAPPISSPALTLTTGGSIDAGTHYYRVSFITALGGTNASGLAGPVTTDATNNAVQISSIPISTDPRVTGRKIWRTKAGATNDTAFLLTTINDNTTTTYLDTKADADLTGGIFDGTYAPNTTHNYLTVGGVTTFGADRYSTRVGLSAGLNLSGASAFMVAIGGNALYSCDAFANTALGYSAGYYTTTGRDNVFLGYASGQRNVDGNYNVLIGDYACLNATTSYMNVVVGHNAMVGVYGTYGSYYNIAIGYSAGRSCLDAESNVFIGWSAGFSASQKTDVSNSMCLGRNTYSTEDGMFVYGDNTVVKHIFQSGNVGYGTNDPQKKLDIRGDGSASFRMTYTPSSVYTDFTCTTAGYYKIEPTGNRVGINCTPSTELDIDGNVNLNNQFTQVSGDTNPGYYLYKSNNLAYGMKLHYLNDSSQFGTMLFTGSSSNTFLAFGRSPDSGIADNDFIEFARFERNTGNFGINETSPNSTLTVNGSVSKAIVTKTSDYTATDDDYTIVIDASSNTVDITLPAVADCTGRIYNLKCIDDTFTVTIDANGSETIDGEVTQILNQWDNMKIQSTGSLWIIL